MTDLQLSTECELLQAIVKALPSCRRCYNQIATVRLDDGDPYCDDCTTEIQKELRSKLYPETLDYAQEVRAYQAWLKSRKT